MLVSSSCVSEGLGGSAAFATGGRGRTGAFAFSSCATAGETRLVLFSAIQAATPPPNRALIAQQTISFFMGLPGVFRARVARQRYLSYLVNRHPGFGEEKELSA